MTVEFDNKLPVIDTMAEATNFVTDNAGRLLTAVLPAGIALCLVQYLGSTSTEETSLWFDLWILAAQGILYALVAINVHRIALLGGDAVPTWGIASWSMRESRFMGWLILIYAVMLGFILIPMIVLMLIGSWAGGASLIAIFASLGMMAIYFSAVYFFCRLMMIFPATAVDRKPDLKWSWHLTEANGWRIFLATTFFPGLIFGLIGVLLGFALFSVDQTYMNLAILPVSLVGMVWAIAILSFTYRYLLNGVNREVDEVGPALADSER